MAAKRPPTGTLSASVGTGGQLLLIPVGKIKQEPDADSPSRIRSTTPILISPSNTPPPSPTATSSNQSAVNKVQPLIMTPVLQRTASNSLLRSTSMVISSRSNHSSLMSSPVLSSSSLGVSPLVITPSDSQSTIPSSLVIATTSGSTLVTTPVSNSYPNLTLQIPLRLTPITQSASSSASSNTHTSVLSPIATPTTSSSVNFISSSGSSSSTSTALSSHNVILQLTSNSGGTQILNITPSTIAAASPIFSTTTTTTTQASQSSVPQPLLILPTTCSTSTEPITLASDSLPPIADEARDSPSISCSGNSSMPPGTIVIQPIEDDEPCPLPTTMSTSALGNEFRAVVPEPVWRPSPAITLRKVSQASSPSVVTPSVTSQRIIRPAINPNMGTLVRHGNNTYCIMPSGSTTTSSSMGLVNIGNTVQSSTPTLTFQRPLTSTVSSSASSASSRGEKNNRDQPPGVAQQPGQLLNYVHMLLPRSIIATERASGPPKLQQSIIIGMVNVSTDKFGNKIKVLECDFCSSSFKEAQPLKLHVLQHHFETCVVCGLMYHTRSDLITHQRRVHTLTAAPELKPYIQGNSMLVRVFPKELTNSSFPKTTQLEEGDTVDASPVVESSPDLPLFGDGEVKLPKIQRHRLDHLKDKYICDVERASLVTPRETPPPEITEDEVPGSLVTPREIPHPEITEDEVPGSLVTPREIPHQEITEDEVPGSLVTTRETPHPEITEDETPGSLVTPRETPHPEITEDETPGSLVTPRETPHPAITDIHLPIINVDDLSCDGLFSSESEKDFDTTLECLKSKKRKKRVCRVTKKKWKSLCITESSGSEYITDDGLTQRSAESDNFELDDSHQDSDYFPSKEECEEYDAEKIGGAEPECNKRKLPTVVDLSDPPLYRKRKRKCSVIDNSREGYVPPSDNETQNTTTPISVPVGYIQESDDSDDETTPDECEIVRDVNKKGIYVRKVIKAQTTKNGKKKKNNRVYDKKHKCPYCCKKVTNFSTHVLKHTDKQNVMEINLIQVAETDTKSERQLKIQMRKKLLNSLQREIEHRSNLNVLEKGKGEIVLGRRFATGQFDVDKYGPCPICFEWLRLSTIVRHQPHCPTKTTKETKGTLITQSQIMVGRVTEKASKLLRDQVFPSMRNDPIGILAREDDMIVAVGNQWIIKNIGNELKRANYTSSTMRLCARLLMALRRITSLEKGKNFFMHYLTPAHFDSVCRATLSCAEEGMDDQEDLSNPTNALKLGHEVKRLSAVKKGFAIRAGAQVIKEETRDFLELIESEWSVKVTKLAKIRLMEMKRNNMKKLPEPDDIQRLSQYINEELKSIDLEDSDSRQRVATLVEALLISYNRRRSGEIEALKIVTYEKRTVGVSNINIEMTRDLTKWEKYLLESQELMETRGKTGKGVPVILPLSVQAHMKFLVSTVNRSATGVHPENDYIFAARGGKRAVYRGYDALSKVASEATLQAPERITSVQLRKYMATVSQVLNMTDAQLKWVYQHMGHTEDVHHLHYRSRSDVIERVELAKILLIQDTNSVKKFVGKTLEEIQFRACPQLLLPKMTQEGDESVLKYRCSCGYTTAHNPRIQAHMFLHFQMSDTVWESNVLECEHCKTPYSKISSMVLHYLRAHQNTPFTPRLLMGGKTIPFPRDAHRSLKYSWEACHRCRMVFGNKRAWHHHLWSSHLNSRLGTFLSCTYCLFKCQNVGPMNSHMKFVHRDQRNTSYSNIQVNANSESQFITYILQTICEKNAHYRFRLSEEDEQCEEVLVSEAGDGEGSTEGLSTTERDTPLSMVSNSASQDDSILVVPESHILSRRHSTDSDATDVCAPDNSPGTPSTTSTQSASPGRTLTPATDDASSDLRIESSVSLADKNDSRRESVAAKSTPVIPFSLLSTVLTATPNPFTLSILGKNQGLIPIQPKMSVAPPGRLQQSRTMSKFSVSEDLISRSAKNVAPQFACLCTDDAPQQTFELAKVDTSNWDKNLYQQTNIRDVKDSHGPVKHSVSVEHSYFRGAIMPLIRFEVFCYNQAPPDLEINYMDYYRMTQVRDGDYRFACKICSFVRTGRIHKVRSVMHIHLQGFHFQGRIFQCYYCEFSPRADRRLLMRHLNQHHPGKRKRIIRRRPVTKLASCSSGQKEVDLVKYMYGPKSRKRGIVARCSAMCWVCQECGRTALLKGDILIHMALTHSPHTRTPLQYKPYHKPRDTTDINTLYSQGTIDMKRARIHLTAVDDMPPGEVKSNSSSESPNITAEDEHDSTSTASLAKEDTEKSSSSPTEGESEEGKKTPSPPPESEENISPEDSEKNKDPESPIEIIPSEDTQKVSGDTDDTQTSPAGEGAENQCTVDLTDDEKEKSPDASGNIDGSTLASMLSGEPAVVCGSQEEGILDWVRRLTREVQEEEYDFTISEEFFSTIPKQRRRGDNTPQQEDAEEVEEAESTPKTHTLSDARKKKMPSKVEHVLSGLTEDSMAGHSADCKWGCAHCEYRSIQPVCVKHHIIAAHVGSQVKVRDYRPFNLKKEHYLYLCPHRTCDYFSKVHAAQLVHFTKNPDHWTGATSPGVPLSRTSSLRMRNQAKTAQCDDLAVDKLALRCFYCSFDAVGDRATLQSHLSSAHHRNQPLAIDIASRGISEDYIIFLCPVCEFASRLKDSFIAHLNVDHHDLEYTLPVHKWARTNTHTLQEWQEDGGDLDKDAAAKKDDVAIEEEEDVEDEVEEEPKRRGRGFAARRNIYPKRLKSKKGRFLRSRASPVADRDSDQDTVDYGLDQDTDEVEDEAEDIVADDDVDEDGDGDDEDVIREKHGVQLDDESEVQDDVVVLEEQQEDLLNQPMVVLDNLDDEDPQQSLELHQVELDKPDEVHQVESDAEPDDIQQVESDDEQDEVHEVCSEPDEVNQEGPHEPSEVDGEPNESSPSKSDTPDDSHIVDSDTEIHLIGSDDEVDADELNASETHEDHEEGQTMVVILEEDSGSEDNGSEKNSANGLNGDNILQAFDQLLREDHPNKPKSKKTKNTASSLNDELKESQKDDGDLDAATGNGPDRATGNGPDTATGISAEKEKVVEGLVTPSHGSGKMRKRKGYRGGLKFTNRRKKRKYFDVPLMESLQPETVGGLIPVDGMETIPVENMGAKVKLSEGSLSAKAAVKTVKKQQAVMARKRASKKLRRAALAALPMRTLRTRQPASPTTAAPSPEAAAAPAMWPVASTEAAIDESIDAVANADIDAVVTPEAKVLTDDVVVANDEAVDLEPGPDLAAPQTCSDSGTPQTQTSLLNEIVTPRRKCGRMPKDTSNWFGCPFHEDFDKKTCTNESYEFRYQTLQACKDHMMEKHPDVADDLAKYHVPASFQGLYFCIDEKAKIRKKRQYIFLCIKKDCFFYCRQEKNIFEHVCDEGTRNSSLSLDMDINYGMYNYQPTGGKNSHLLFGGKNQKLEDGSEEMTMSEEKLEEKESEEVPTQDVSVEPTEESVVIKVAKPKKKFVFGKKKGMKKKKYIRFAIKTDAAEKLKDNLDEEINKMDSAEKVTGDLDEEITKTGSVDRVDKGGEGKVFEDSVAGMEGGSEKVTEKVTEKVPEQIDGKKKIKKKRKCLDDIVAGQDNVIEADMGADTGRRLLRKRKLVSPVLVDEDVVVVAEEPPHPHPHQAAVVKDGSEQNVKKHRHQPSEVEDVSEQNVKKYPHRRTGLEDGLEQSVKKHSHQASEVEDVSEPNIAKRRSSPVIENTGAETKVTKDAIESKDDVVQKQLEESVQKPEDESEMPVVDDLDLPVIQKSSNPVKKSLLPVPLLSGHGDFGLDLCLSKVGRIDTSKTFSSGKKKASALKGLSDGAEKVGKTGSRYSYALPFSKNKTIAFSKHKIKRSTETEESVKKVDELAKPDAFVADLIDMVDTEQAEKELASEGEETKTASVAESVVEPVVEKKKKKKKKKKHAESREVCEESTEVHPHVSLKIKRKKGSRTAFQVSLGPDEEVPSVEIAPVVAPPSSESDEEMPLIKLLSQGLDPTEQLGETPGEHTLNRAPLTPPGESLENNIPQEAATATDMMTDLDALDTQATNAVQKPEDLVTMATSLENDGNSGSAWLDSFSEKPESPLQRDDDIDRGDLHTSCGSPIKSVTSPNSISNPGSSLSSYQRTASQQNVSPCSASVSPLQANVSPYQANVSPCKSNVSPYQSHVSPCQPTPSPCQPVSTPSVHSAVASPALLSPCSVQSRHSEGPFSPCHTNTQWPPDQPRSEHSRSSSVHSNIAIATSPCGSQQGVRSPATGQQQQGSCMGVPPTSTQDGRGSGGPQESAVGGGGMMGWGPACAMMPPFQKQPALFPAHLMSMPQFRPWDDPSLMPMLGGVPGFNYPHGQHPVFPYPQAGQDSRGNGSHGNNTPHNYSTSNPGVGSPSNHPAGYWANPNARAQSAESLGYHSRGPSPLVGDPHTQGVSPMYPPGFYPPQRHTPTSPFPVTRETTPTPPHPQDLHRYPTPADYWDLSTGGRTAPSSGHSRAASHNANPHQGEALQEALQKLQGYHEHMHQYPS